MDDARAIVIGSGPSGAMAAHELVRRGVPTTMLESGTTFAGGLLFRANGRNLYRKAPVPTRDLDGFVATGDPETTWFYNLSPGGLSNQWTGAVPRFDPRDFTEGERLHERYRWPIAYEDLAPFYEKAERLLHITACPDEVPNLPVGWMHHRRWLPRDWRAIAPVARAHGQGLTALPLADGPDWLLARQGTAFNSFAVIVRSLMASPHFQLKTGAHALRLEWSGAKRRVDAVLYHDRSTGSQQRLPAAGVIVACGPLHSAKLLFDSACPDFPQGLGNAEGLLGRYLHDHPKEWWSFSTGKPIARLAPAGYLTRRPYDDSPPLIAQSWTLGHATQKDKILSLTPLKTNAIGVQMFGTMVPSEKYYVRPHADRRDEFGLPQLEIHIEFEPEVIENMIESRKRLLCLMEEAGYSCTLHPVVPQLHPGYAAHYGGTVRMHKSRKYGVLDEWNRPFDIPNVFVTDASSFPTNSEKNPTLTAMALSARAAHRFADDRAAGA